MQYVTYSVEETIKLAKDFADGLTGGEVVLLCGELGAGKTTFSKGLALSFGVDDVITSPTFTIIKEYEGSRLDMYHMDMYRLDDDASELGFDEYFGKKGAVCVVEWNKWPTKGYKTYTVQFEYLGDNSRRITIDERTDN